MTHVTPAVTTRPLFHIAQRHGVDYTAVLNIAWGIKLQLRDEPPTEATNKALTDLHAKEGWRVAYDEIFAHVSEFVALQGSALRPQLAGTDFSAVEERVLGHLVQTGHDEYTEAALLKGLGTDPDLEGIRKAMTDQPEFPDDLHCRDV